MSGKRSGQKSESLKDQRSNAPRSIAKQAPPVRSCLRCFCTQGHSCTEGCQWVADSDVCSACLTPGEKALWFELHQMISIAVDPRAEKLAKVHLRHFAKFLAERFFDMPLQVELAKLVKRDEAGGNGAVNRKSMARGRA